MKKLFVISVTVCIILTACGGQNNIPPTAISSFTPQATFTATSTPTKTPRPTSTPTSTITPLPPYQNKQVLFDYYVIGDHSVYDSFFGWGSFRSYSRLILYDDGQLILTGEKYKQKFLSPKEIKQFLSKLEALGFYSFESNQKHDPTDKLYDYGNNYQKSYDGREYCIVVNNDRPRNLCIYEPDRQYLISKMKSLLEYFDEYEPADMTLYYPDRILLWAQSGRDPYNDNLPKTAITWDKKFPRLEDSIIYVNGDLAKEIYMFYESTNQGNVFIQDGKEYTVYINVVLPHEKVTNADQ